MRWERESWREREKGRVRERERKGELEREREEFCIITHVGRYTCIDMPKFNLSILEIAHLVNLVKSES